MSKELNKYRDHLILAEQKAQESYDKTILSLSGGALGISFAFVNGFVDMDFMKTPETLLWAWILWGASMTMILISYFTSQMALRKAINQTDAKSIYDARPGGCYDIITCIANILGGITFILGVSAMIFFVSSNWKV